MATRKAMGGFGHLLRWGMLVVAAVLTVGTSCAKEHRGDDTTRLEYAQALLREHNLVRRNPKGYAEQYIKPLLKDGDADEQECYDALMGTPAMEPLSLYDGLMQSAQWFAEDHAVSGKVGHNSSNGEAFHERIRRFSPKLSGCGENCAYGERKSVRELVIDLLIDKGIPSRGHRHNILGAQYNMLGVGYYKHEKVPYGSVTVLDYATKAME